MCMVCANMTAEDEDVPLRLDEPFPSVTSQGH